MSLTCYHLGFGSADLVADDGCVLSAALLCGDPVRARRVAFESNSVTCLKVLSENRGLHSYLCRMDDGPLFISATSGMGAPSLSIVVNELAQLGIKQIIRVGTCGGIADQVKVGSVVISQAALCRQGAALDIAPRDFPASADPFLTVAMVRAAEVLGIDHHIGVTASVDTFFEGQERNDSANPHLLRSLQGITDEYRNLGILNYEMEAGTLFKMGLVYGISTGCICAVLAERLTSEAVLIEQKKLAEEHCILVALNALKEHFS